MTRPLSRRGCAPAAAALVAALALVMPAAAIGGLYKCARDDLAFADARHEELALARIARPLAALARLALARGTRRRGRRRHQPAVGPRRHAKGNHRYGRGIALEIAQLLAFGTGVVMVRDA
jgi:hypothetical protein